MTAILSIERANQRAARVSTVAKAIVKATAPTSPRRAATTPRAVAAPRATVQRAAAAPAKTQPKSSGPLTSAQRAMREYDADPLLKKTFKGDKGKLAYVELRSAELDAANLAKRLGARPGVDPAAQAADEWKRNVGGCRDRFVSEAVYAAARRVELARTR